MAIAHGAFSQSMSIVTAYDSLGEEGVRHSLVATKAKAIFLESHLIKILKPSLQQATDLQVIVYNDHDIKQGDIDDLKKTHEHLVVLSFEELRELGEANPVDPVPPKSEDLSCIMYTSGSSGTPKGVILKHKQVIAAGKEIPVMNYSQSCILLIIYSCGGALNLRRTHYKQRYNSGLPTSRTHCRNCCRALRHLLGSDPGIR